MDNKNYAVLVDSDNIACKYIEGIIEELSNFGNTPVRRVYGDFNNKNEWKDTCLTYSFKQMHQFNYTIGKSATDATMIIDAMDLLYKESYLDGFVIVSSDSDFTGLCQRLREANKEVIGMGEKKTPASIISACSSFKYLENLIKNESSEDEPKSIKDISFKIEGIISENNGSISVSRLKEKLVKLQPDFDEKNYGYNQMKKLLEAIGLKIENRSGTAYVSVKDYENKLNKEKKHVSELIIDFIKKSKDQNVNLGQIQKHLLEKKLITKI